MIAAGEKVHREELTALGRSGTLPVQRPEGLQEGLRGDRAEAGRGRRRPLRVLVLLTQAQGRPQGRGRGGDVARRGRLCSSSAPTASRRAGTPKKKPRSRRMPDQKRQGKRPPEDAKTKADRVRCGRVDLRAGSENHSDCAHFVGLAQGSESGRTRCSMGRQGRPHSSCWFSFSRGAVRTRKTPAIRDASVFPARVTGSCGGDVTRIDLTPEADGCTLSGLPGRNLLSPDGTITADGVVVGTATDQAGAIEVANPEGTQWLDCARAARHSLNVRRTQVSPETQTTTRRALGTDS